MDRHPDRASVTRPSRARVYVAVSIILHVALILFWGVLKLALPPSQPGAWDEQADKKLAFELIDIPDQVAQATPDSETNLVSDKQTHAADTHPEDLTSAGEPYAMGDLEVERYEQRRAEDGSAESYHQEEDGEESHCEDRGDDRLAELLIPGPNINYLDEMRGSHQRSSRTSAGYRNLLSSAERQGGFSFNTYNWDFAPYMLAMKHKVESNLRPPYAFTHMGAVSGTNIVRFVVLPSGRIQNLEVLSSDAHFSLDETSVRAIELSVPFLPLPKGFPEDFLEVTARFAYIVDPEPLGLR